MRRLSFKHTVLLSSALFVFTLFGIVMINPPQASATHGTIPASVAPAWVRNTIADKCHNQGWNIVQLQWISPRGAPGATSMTVIAGSATAPLQLNWITYRCRSSTHSYGSSFVVDTNPEIPTLENTITDFLYPGSANTYRTNEGAYPRNFNYPGPFNSTRDITLTLTTRGTATNTSNQHFCAVVGNEARVSTPHQHNFTPQPGYCVQSSNNFTIRVNVVADTGTCSISLNTSSPAPGATFTATFTVRNTGTYADWIVAGRPVDTSPPPNANRYQLGSGNNTVAAPWDNTIFQQVPPPSAIPDGVRHDRLELPGQDAGAYGRIIFHGQTYTFTQTFRAPATTGSYTFAWRLLQRGVKNFTNAGSTCSRTVTVGTPFAMSCGSLSPRSVEVNEPFAMSLEYNNDSAAGGPTVNFANYRMSVNQAGPPGYSNTNLPFTDAPPGGSGTGTAPPAGTISITSPGTYEVLMIMYDRRGTASFADDTEVLRCDTSDDFTTAVVTKPFFTVLGSDVAVGMSGCPGWAGASVGSLKAWNNGGVAAANRGSGTNLAVLAIDVIEQFASAQGSTAPTGLTFANNPVLSGFGGNYPTGNPCPSNYFAAREGNPALPASQVQNTDTVYNLAGSQPINAFGPTTITPGNTPKIYVAGDVRILNNIILTHGGSLDTLANFELIVEGNIYIHPRVTQLHGTYIAQPNALGVGGKIYSCSNGNFGAPTEPQLLSTDPTTGCQRTLNVFGAFIAKELKLYRSNGSVLQGTAAEVFNYSPTWLAPEPVSGGSTLRGSYDSITSLPPVL